GLTISRSLEYSFLTLVDSFFSLKDLKQTLSKSHLKSNKEILSDSLNCLNRDINQKIDDVIVFFNFYFRNDCFRLISRISMSNRKNKLLNINIESTNKTQLGKT